MEENHKTFIKEQEYADSATQRTIIDLIDVETGELFDATMLDSMTEAELTALKEVQSIAKKSGKYKYVCAVCGQPLRLDSRQYTSRRFKSYFFSHYTNEEDCPLKTSSDAIDPIRSTIRFYDRYKESSLHKNMYQTLMKVLSEDKRFSDIESRPTINIYGENIHWHKPDIASSFYGNKLIFETLIYNTFLSSIVDKKSFYRMANSFLIWLFPHFSLDNQTMCEKDIFYTHRRNIFVFDSESYYQSENDNDNSKPKKPKFVEKEYLYAQEESLRQGRLMLNCYWQTPVVEGKNVKIEWHHKLVDIEELTFDAIRKDVYFHNSDYDFKEVADPQKRELIENWERAKEERWDKIFQGIQERKKHHELIASKKIARKNEEEMLTRILSGEIVPEPFVQEDKYGFKADDVVVIKPQYAKVSQFHEGVAIVTNKRGKRGLINLKNERVINIEYNRLQWLDAEDRKIVICSKNGTAPYHLYYTSGKEVINYRIKAIKKINGNYIYIKYPSGKYGIMSKDGNILIEALYDRITPKDNEKYVLSFSGRTKTISAQVEEVKTNVISEVLPGKFIAERLLCYGIIDSDGNTILPFEYSKLERISDRFISIVKKESRHSYYGILDNTLNVVFPLSSATITFLQNGNIIRSGILYRSDLSVLLEGFSSIEFCPDGKYILCKNIKEGWHNSSKYGLADSDGNIIFPCIASTPTKGTNGNADFIIRNLDNGGSIRSCFGIFALFSADGNILTKETYSGMEALPNGNLLVRNQGKVGIIDKDGRLIVACNHKRIDLTDTGDIKVTCTPIDGFCQKACRINLYALSDRNGICLTDFKYDEIASIANGIYIATKGSSRELLDKHGNIFHSLAERTGVSMLNDTLILIENYSLFATNQRFGVINIEGKAIIPVKYSHIDLLPNGNLKVTLKECGETRYGIYNADGTVVAECKYRSITTDTNGNICPEFFYLGNGFFATLLLDKYSLANGNKELLTDYSYDTLKVFNECYFHVSIGCMNGLIDKDGNTALPMTDENIIGHVAGDRFVVGKYGNKGIKKADGSFIIPLLYSDITQLPNNTWKVEKRSYDNSTYGIYNDEGEVIYECKYLELITDEEGNLIPSYSTLNDDIIAARKLDKYALSSATGEILTEYVYDKITYIGNDYYAVEANSMYGVIDRYGNEFTAMSGYKVRTVVDEDHLIATRMMKESIINRSGTPLTAKEYANITSLGNGLFLGKDSLYHKYLPKETNDLINNKGEVIFTTDRSIKLDENLRPVISTAISLKGATVKECSGKYAICNGDTVLLSDFIYDYVDVINDSLFITRKNNGYGLVDLKGSTILPPEYHPEFEICSNGIIKFCKTDATGCNYGLCDSTGKIQAEANYCFIRENRPGHFKLFYKEGGEQKSKFLNLEKNKGFILEQTYEGIVNDIKDYGVFVKVPRVGYGLLHIKQIKKRGMEIGSFSNMTKIQVKVIKIRENGKVEFDLAHEV